MWNTIKIAARAVNNAFSNSSLAALRNILGQCAILVGGLGLAGLTQTNLQHLVDSIMQFGYAVGALLTAAGVLWAAAMPIIAWIKANLSNRAKSTAADIRAEANLPAVQQVATIAVADALGKRTDVKELNVVDPALAKAVPSDKVVAK